MIKLLLIEDDPLMSQMYQDIFAFDEYKIMTADNGQKGLELARNEHPTLILCDIMMPVMNGLEVLEKLKADDALKNIPVIMLTNLAGTEDAKRALMKGAVKYIVKSNFTPKQVSDMVGEVLKGYTRNDIPSSS